MSVYRIYVEKKQEFATEAKAVLAELTTALKLNSLEDVRVINRFDVDNVTEGTFTLASDMVFSDPTVDNVYYQLPKLKDDEYIIPTEYLSGQYDQRADMSAECIRILAAEENPLVRYAKIYIIKGNFTDDEFDSIINYLINPVESKKATLEEYDTLEVKYDIPTKVDKLDGFIDLNDEGLKSFIEEYSLAMDIDDIKFCRDYFKNEEDRNPTITEIRMIDTYWSDHCRHTTFLTNIDNIKIDSPYIEKIYQDYINTREEIYVSKQKPISMMDVATLAAKKLRKDGLLDSLDESEEINACSVNIEVDVDGKKEDLLLMFKNEKHNHTTEIEPFGGASTCLGGAIRDPLSGRSYVYQAMRISGAGNPLMPVEDTIAGKLPQRKITVTAANGYSSYGNQIGLAAGQISEIYHDGYVAKRLEAGALVGAAPKSNVVRETPAAGDVVILLGGKTGRDGCGGATGSSKSHTSDSLSTCGAEVQKGNAPEERKIVRLFRKPEVTTLIKRCNDFGAGGVSVAIGELADGLIIDLDSIPTKYDGLDGTEIAISESQERMAVVVAKEDADKIIKEADKENLDATLVAVVTEQPRLTMHWKGNTIVDLSRNFLNSNGAVKHTNIHVAEPELTPISQHTNSKQSWLSHISDLNICSQKGLAERFDSTIGGGTVLSPLGGKNQLTPIQAMVAKLPVLNADTSTCSLMSWGYNPFLSQQSPFHGAMSAVIESIAKIIATGGTRSQCWLSFQEFFEDPKDNPTRWGKPFSALLGAFKAQLELGCGAIGGKDSMSGSFEDIDVPPTLISFAVSASNCGNIISPEFKDAGDKVILLTPDYDENNVPEFESVRNVFDTVEELIKNKTAKSAWAIGYGGVAEAISKMCFGNGFGFDFKCDLSDKVLFEGTYGSFIIAVDKDAEIDGKMIGEVTNNAEIKFDDFSIGIEELKFAWESKLEPIFPTKIDNSNTDAKQANFDNAKKISPSIKVAKPQVVIPIITGTNSEYDLAREFENAGANVEVFVMRDRNIAEMQNSIDGLESIIKSSQIMVLPSGFAGGEKSEGSGMFLASLLSNTKIKDAVLDLLDNRDGLMLGINSGFNALLKLGLLPYGEYRKIGQSGATLTSNAISRYQSKFVNTRISSNKSPWLYSANVGDIHTLPISHDEGRFVASKELIDDLARNGQIVAQYVDNDGEPSINVEFNPSTSVCAIESISSPDGRILGKMAHNERIGSDNVYKNITGNFEHNIFKDGVSYFL